MTPYGLLFSEQWFLTLGVMQPLKNLTKAVDLLPGKAHRPT